MRPRAVILGSGAGGGVPQWNCRCRICCLARAGDPRVRPRTQACLAITGDGESWAFVGASPDIRAQIEGFPPLHPRSGLRHSPIASVVLPGAEIDQIAGLLSLREGHAFRIIATGPVLAWLAASPIFAALGPGVVRREGVEPGAWFAAAPGVSMMLVPIPGKLPLYAEAPPAVTTIAQGPASPDPAAVTDDQTLAVVARVGATRLAYVPACAVLSDAVIRLLDGADVVLFDGTVFTDGELIEAGVSAKTGARMGHVAISGPVGSLAGLASIAARRRILTHINNTNPILVDGSRERALVTEAGWEVAHDGLELPL